MGGKTPFITNMGSLCIYVKLYQNHLHCNFFLSGVSSTNLMEQQKSVAQNKFKFHHLVWVHPITQDVSHHQDYYQKQRIQVPSKPSFATVTGSGVDSTHSQVFVYLGHVWDGLDKGISYTLKKVTWNLKWTPGRDEPTWKLSWL